MDERRTTPPQTQQPLPFDDESDDPVPYSLTARARRAVAPEALPALEVVPDAGDATGVAEDVPGTEDGALDAAGDTRPSRARALRRAGLSLEAIARQLDADELAVRAWLGGLAGRARVHRRVARHAHGDAVAGARAVERERARARAPERIRRDPAFAAGLGLVAGTADIDAHGIAVTTRNPRLAATVGAWLVEHAAVPRSRLRVVLRLGRDVAADRARHRWAQELGLAIEQIIHTRVGNTAPDDEEALLRIGDARVAATVAGWADALLDPPAQKPVDAAF